MTGLARTVYTRCPVRPRLPGSICSFACAPPATNKLWRSFSVQGIYATFPATLLRYSARQKSSLFDIKERKQRKEDPYDDAVKVSADGLVYPGGEDQSSCEVLTNGPTTATETDWLAGVATNGAVLMPNTFLMQETIRTYYDSYANLKGNIEPPLILTIPKGKWQPNLHKYLMLISLGTPVARDLILFHEFSTQFSLQPSHAMPLQGTSGSNYSWLDTEYLQSWINHWTNSSQNMLRRWLQKNGLAPIASTCDGTSEVLGGLAGENFYEGEKWTDISTK